MDQETGILESPQATPAQQPQQQQPQQQQPQAVPVSSGIDPAGLRMWASHFNHARQLDPKFRLPAGDKPGVALHPFRLTDRKQYIDQVKGSGIFKRAETATIQEIPLKDLWTVQRTVNLERLQSHYADPAFIPAGSRAAGHGGLVDIPIVVRVGGRLYIHDGNHRATAAHLRGQPSIRARVVDLDGEGWVPRGARHQR